ncbi:MAG: Pls/PosA family non-ribosomal peptide synthetase [Aquihabitans sp.]
MRHGTLDPAAAQAGVLQRGRYAPEPRTLIDVFERTVARYPEAPALDDGVVPLSYRATLAAAHELAGELRSLGVRRGDRVGIRLPSGTNDLYVGILGILLVGAAYVPVDADDPESRATLVFGEAAVAAVLEVGGARVARRPGTIGAEELHQAPLGEETADLDDDAWIIFTSGSTGTPKGVAVSHRSAAAFVDAESRLFVVDAPIAPGDRVLAGLSVAFDASCEEMWLAWAHGACLVPAPRSLVRSGMDLGPWLVSHDITVVSTVPTLASLWPVEALDDVRLLIFGGEPCPADLAARLSVDGREVWNTYGPTEATVVACAARLTGDAPIRIGLPLDGWDLAVVDAQGAPVGEGEVGELIIGGVGLARYLDPAKDAEKYAPFAALGWERAYRSGDLVRFETSGLVFEGRADEQVKLGGRRIELGEVDAALQAVAGVAGAAAAVKVTRSGNQILVGYLVAAPDRALDLDAVSEGLREVLPAALVPRLITVASLPTRTSGKVDRNALPWPPPARRGTSADSDGDRAAKLDGEARWVSDQWEAILGAPVAGLDDDFFTHGGGSLAAAQLVVALRSRYPAVTVADIYDHPRLGALVDALAGMAPPLAVVDRTVVPVPPRAQVIQTLLSVPLQAVVGVRWLTGLAVLNAVMRFFDGPAWVPVVPVWALVVASLLVFTPPGRMGMAALATRALLRDAHPGTYPRGGSLHVRLWFAERLVEAFGATNLSGAPWTPYFARALGATVGRGVDLHSLPPITGLLTLGAGCSIEPEVDLSGYWIDGDELIIGAIEVGEGARVGARTTLLPGATVGAEAVVAAGSTVAGTVPAGQTWTGSPAVRTIPTSGQWPVAPPAPARSWLVAYAVAATLVGALPLVAGLAGLLVVGVAIRGTDDLGSAMVRALVAAPAAAMIAMAVLAVATVISVRLLSIGISEGYHPVRGRIGIQVWASLRILDDARTWLFPIYSSLVTPTWLRLLGASVGKGVEASTVLLLPSMTRVGDGAFLADDTLVGAYELGGGWLHIEKSKVGKRAFLGNSGMTAPGRRVRKHSLVAVLSAAPERAKAGSSWLGSPPVRLRRPVEAVDEARTFAPSRRVVAARAFVEVLRLVPVMVSAAVAVGVLVGFEWAVTNHGWLVAAALGGPILLTAGALAAAITTLAKWLIVGDTEPGEHPLWSSFVWRNEVVDTFVEILVAPWFANVATGTPALVWWLRSLGARIGRGVWCETYWLPEADLVELQRASTVNRGCVVQTHLFHDRVMSLDTVTLHEGSTLGPHGVILPAASIGVTATVGPASLVMRGDELPAGTRWTGNPIAPWIEPSS